MKYNIYDKKHVVNRINEIISLDYFKKFRNEEIYAAINSLGFEREKILLLPNYNEEEEKILIYTLKQMKHFMLLNRKNKKELNNKVILKIKLDDKESFNLENVVNIKTIVERNSELLERSEQNDRYDLSILNRYIKYTGESKKELAGKIGTDVRTLKLMLDGKPVTYYQLNKVLKFFDCYTYEGLLKKIDSYINKSFSELSKEFFSSDINYVSINLCLMWEAIKYSDFDEDTISIANYLFSGKKINIDDAVATFNKTKQDIIFIKEQCLNAYKKYIQNPNKYIYKM